MNIFLKMQQLSKQVGAIRGEDAETFRKRNPEGARILAEFIKANHAEMTRAIAGVLVKGQ